MKKGKDLKYSLLLDYYGNVLTEKQKDVLELYYNEDLSLGEISDHLNITRQGVRDAIQRGMQSLETLESKLKIIERYGEFDGKIEELLTYSLAIKQKARAWQAEGEITQMIDILEKMRRED